MNIKKEQIQKEPCQIKDNSLIIGEQSYYTNDIVIGYISNQYFEGRILVGINGITLLQNETNTGVLAEKYNNLGFKYMYTSGLYGDVLGSGVLLYNYKKDETTIENIKLLNEKYPLPNLHINKYGRLISLKHSCTFFRVKEIELCCGAVLLYDFPRRYLYNSHSCYDKLNEEDIAELNDYIEKYLNTNKICYLLKDSESESINFLTKHLKFKIVDEFTNKNTANKLKILSRNQ